MGAGDAKLMAALGAIVGPANWFSIFLITAVLGGITGLIAAIVTGRARQTFSNLYIMLIALMNRTAPYKMTPQLDVRSNAGLRMPHAVSIALAALWFVGASVIHAG